MATPQINAVPFKVEGKTALVTGAGSGINFSFAAALVARKCNVLIADLALRPEAQKLIDDNPSQPKVAFIKTDVRIWDDLTNMFDEAEKLFGGADIVCPGAGVFEPLFSNFWLPPGSEQSQDNPRGHGPDGVGTYATMDINCTHPIRTTQIAISRWLYPSPTSKIGKASPSNPKRVVCISSVAGQTVAFPFPLYIASKHAVSGFIGSMGPLEGLGIRVNGVAPGLIKTPLWTDHPEKYATVNEKDIWVEPEEVAEQMVRCVEDDEIGPAVVWEVLKGNYRKVPFYDAPPPQGPASRLSDYSYLYEQALGWLNAEGWGVVEGKK